MIVMLKRKGLSGHSHITECDSLHIQKQTNKKEKAVYTQIIVSLNGKTIREWHAGRIETDYLYIFDKGVQVDLMSFHPEKTPKKAKKKAKKKQ